MRDFCLETNIRKVGDCFHVGDHRRWPVTGNLPGSKHRADEAALRVLSTIPLRCPPATHTLLAAASRVRAVPSRLRPGWRNPQIRSGTLPTGLRLPCGANRVPAHPRPARLLPPIAASSPLSLLCRYKRTRRGTLGSCKLEARNIIHVHSRGSLYRSLDPSGNRVFRGFPHEHRREVAPTSTINILRQADRNNMGALFRQIEYRALSASAFAEHEAFVDRRRLVRLAAIGRGRCNRGSRCRDDRLPPRALGECPSRP